MTGGMQVGGVNNLQGNAGDSTLAKIDQLTSQEAKNLLQVAHCGAGPVDCCMSSTVSQMMT